MPLTPPISDNIWKEKTHPQTFPNPAEQKLSRYYVISLLLPSYNSIKGLMIGFLVVPNNVEKGEQHGVWY